MKFMGAVAFVAVPHVMLGGRRHSDPYKLLPSLLQSSGLVRVTVLLQSSGLAFDKRQLLLNFVDDSLSFFDGISPVDQLA